MRLLVLKQACLNRDPSLKRSVLEAMRANSISEIAFSSAGFVYGEASLIPAPEDQTFSTQTSPNTASSVTG